MPSSEAYFDIRFASRSANLRQAYIYYFLEGYTKAYTALCKAAEIAYKKQLYNLYYIVQFNKCKIENYVEHSSNASEDILNKINKDVVSIHLDNILMDMPDSSSVVSKTTHD